MTNLEKTKLLYDFIDSLFPNAKCELFYSQDYELVIAVMLSAQTTDKSVNKVTSILFSKYPTIEDLDKAPLKEIENIIKPLGLYKNKAINIKGITHKLVTDFNGKVPSDKDMLQTLPGIGNKSAGVIRAEVFKIPDLAVDTHILRVSKRLGLVKEDASPIEVEKTLKKYIEKEHWIEAHHKIIHFGRYFCTARNPQCEKCKLKKICKH